MFDLVCTAISMVGLTFVNVSIYQMMRGAAIVFVALLKEFFLGDSLKKYQWIGITWNVLSIILVGLTAILAPQSDSSTTGSPILGILMILFAAFIGALQFSFEGMQWRVFSNMNAFLLVPNI